MKLLYLDCGMGAAGDMLAAALLSLFPDPEQMLDRLNTIGIPGVRYVQTPSVKCGITGTQLSVLVNGETEGDHSHDHGHEHDHSHDHIHDHLHNHDHGHTHRGMAEIEHLVRTHLDLPDAVRADVLAVFGLLAGAESRVHGVPVPEIHFHEVGTLDAVADIAAVCLLMHALSPDETVASPVCTGFGQVQCAHGVLPVPAPATAELLRGIPAYGGTIRGELCTPTGAALLRHFVTRFGEMPVMKTTAIGYGMGVKDFPAANCVRALLGESAQTVDTVTALSCNLDDMTPEAIGFAMETLLENGALDVYTVPIGMKKSRPGVMLCVLCQPQAAERMTALLFRHTSTLGVRESTLRRQVLDRVTETVETPLGPVRRKTATGWGVQRVKYEYDDLARLAKERDCSLREIAAQLPETD